MKNHVAAIEMDGGAEKPIGFGFGGGGEERVGARAGRRRWRRVSPAAFQRAVEIGKLLAGIDGGAISPGGGGSDIAPLMSDGVPGFGVHTVGTHYFDWHHTDADSFDKIVPQRVSGERGCAGGDELRAGGHAGADRGSEVNVKEITGMNT